VLRVGIDWAKEVHLVALGRPGEGVIEVVWVGHNPRAVDALVNRVAALELDPAEVRVVIETRHGLLVDRLVDAGFVVVPVNPDLISRRHGPAKKVVAERQIAFARRSSRTSARNLRTQTTPDCAVPCKHQHQSQHGAPTWHRLRAPTSNLAVTDVIAGHSKSSLVVVKCNL
jgi:hypothetical protein